MSQHANTGMKLVEAAVQIEKRQKAVVVFMSDNHWGNRIVGEV